MLDIAIFIALAILAAAHRISRNRELETRCNLLEEALQKAMSKCDVMDKKYEKLYKEHQMCSRPVTVNVDMPVPSFNRKEIERIMGVMGLPFKGPGVELTAIVEDENKLDKVIRTMDEEDVED